MYQCTIVCVGSLKEDFWKRAITEYTKRLSPMVRVTVIEVPATAFKKVTDGVRVKKEEGTKLIANIQKHSYIIALDPAGKKMTSEQFAATIGTIGMPGTHITFLIGGPLGLSEEVKERSNIILSLSSLTFTHQLARIVLFEQLYRAMTIIHGKTYHY